MNIIRKAPEKFGDFNEWRWFFEGGSTISPVVELAICTDWHGEGNWNVTLRVSTQIMDCDDIGMRSIAVSNMIFEANAIRERMSASDFAELNEAREARRAEMKRAQAERRRKLDAVPRFGKLAASQLLHSSVAKVKQQRSIGNGLRVTFACTPAKLENEQEIFFELTADDQNRAVFRDQFGASRCTQAGCSHAGRFPS
jgi:hypothetical protein